MIQSLLACVLLPAAAAADQWLDPARKKTMVTTAISKGLETREAGGGTKSLRVGEDRLHLAYFTP